MHPLLTLQKQGRLLFDQQCWCWGCDIRRPQGNLLLAYGFTRQRHPNPRYSSTYHHEKVVLWGFGALWAGRLYIRRDGFSVRLVDGLPADICDVAGWFQAPVPRSESERDEAVALLRDFADWVAAYENWVEQTCGLPYREGCVSGWHKVKRAQFAADEMAGVWRDMAAFSPRIQAIEAL